MTIKFGTSGWRDIIADGFSFPKLRILSQAIAEQIFKEKNHNKPVVVGYDTRFLSEHFAKEAATILANNGMEVRFSHAPVPTPVVAFEIIRSQAAGGINITASHNPYSYNGLKFSSAWGGPALPETTRAVEQLCTMIKDNEVALKAKPENAHLIDKLIQRLDFRPAYTEHVTRLLDTRAFKRIRLKIVVDVLHGTGRGYLPEILRSLGCDVEALHENRDVLFEGRGPDPSDDMLQTLVAAVKKSKAHLGLACDGDADRFGVVDADGTIFPANDILALLALHLHKSRGWQGVIARSVMTTHAIDAVARKYGLEVKETPVGFKHIGEVMKELDSIMPSTEGEFVMGAEESGGFTMRGHVPEKDGILACLLVAEMVALSKKTVGALLKELHQDVGPYLTRRINVHSTPELVSSLRDQFVHKPPVSINGLHVHRIVDIDGFKFIFQGGGWLGVRFSGTEPIVRFYYEGNSPKQLDTLIEAGQSLVKTAPVAKKHAKH